MCAWTTNTAVQLNKAVCFCRARVADVGISHRVKLVYARVSDNQRGQELSHAALVLLPSAASQSSAETTTLDLEMRLSLETAGESSQEDLTGQRAASRGTTRAQ
jgi:hypothetical protein